MTQWATIASEPYPQPRSRTALTLFGGQDTVVPSDNGPASLNDSMFGSATGTFSIKGNSLGFTSQTLCGMGDIHGAPKLGVNVSNFQIWPLVCRPGDRFCGCYGNSMVQAKDLIIKETLVQCGENSPSIRTPGEPYHERSDLSGQTWVFFYSGRTVSLTFERGGRVTISDPDWGPAAAWRSVGPEAVRIDTHNGTFIGTLGLDARTIGAKVYRGNSRTPEYEISLKRSF